MRLYLAVAMLVLAFVAYTEAQDATIEERFSKFGDQVTEFGRTLAEKAKTTFQDIQTSDFFTSSRDWLSQQLEKLKSK